MINLLSLLTIVFCLTLQNTTKKLCEKNITRGAMVFSAGSTFFALLVFLIPVIGNFQFNSTTIGYSLLFALFYSMGVVFSFLAILDGPLSITSLVISFSLIIPTFYGLFALKEPSSLSLYIGILCLCVSLCLVNIEQKGEKKRLTFRWAVYTALAFLGNGSCSTVQKIQIVSQNGEFKNEFMVISLIISFLVIMFFAIIKERKTMAINLKKGLLFYGLCGIANGVVNLLVIFLSNGRLASAILFPFVSAGSMIFTFIISIMFFKEKLSRIQWLGFFGGVLSIVFLNL